MTEQLSGFTAARPLAQVGPQSLRLPTSLSEVCACESDCAASRILKGLAQIVGARLTNCIDIKVQAVDTPEKVRVCVEPWDRYGVETKGAAPPGAWIAVDGSEVVGMGNDEYAARWSNNIPLEWTAETAPPAAELAEDGKVILAFPQPSSANRPFTYTVRNEQGDGVSIGGGRVDPDGTVVLQVAAELHNPGDTDTFVVHVATQYAGVEADSAPVTVSVPEPEPEPEPEPQPEPEQEGS